MAPDEQDTRLLIQLQIELEYALDPEGLLVPFPGSSEQAHFVVYRYPGGYARYFRHDLPPEIRARLVALPPERAYEERQAVASILGPEVDRGGAFVSCVFAAPPGPEAFPDAASRAAHWVVEVVGEPVSWAWSSRENAAAAELAVETAPAFRRRGYGRQVAAAWAHDVMRRGKVAFYSYAEDNYASQALARSLGVLAFASVVAYTGWRGEPQCV